MNYLVISVLSIIVLILLYVLYTYYISSSTTLVALSYLMNPTSPISGTNIKIPNTVHYSYGVWMYVNTWGSINKTIFSVVDSVSQKVLFDLTLGSTSLTLNTDISVAGKLQNIMITNNFPVQKWVYVIVSVDGSIVDVYLDGKLVISTILKNNGTIMNSDVSNTPQINFGNGYDIYLSKFQRWTYPMDPQTAWNNYYQGNGQSNSTSYGAKLAITNSNILQQEVKLF